MTPAEWEVRYGELLEERIIILGGIEARLKVGDRTELENFKKMCLDPDIGDALFINVCCWTYDPRNDEQLGGIIGDVPFLLWPRQEECAR